MKVFHASELVVFGSGRTPVSSSSVFTCMYNVYVHRGYTTYALSYLYPLVPNPWDKLPSLPLPLVKFSPFPFFSHPFPLFCGAFLLNLGILEQGRLSFSGSSLGHSGPEKTHSEARQKD